MMSSPKISRLCSRDRGTGYRHRGFLVCQKQDQAHSIESAVITACAAHAQGVVYTFYLFSIKDMMHKQYEMSAVCSRSSQVNVAKVLTELHVPNRLDNAGQITVARYALFSVGVPHTLGSCRCGRTHAKGQSKRAVKWRNVKFNACTLLSCGSGVTLPYRNGLLEPMHRTGSGWGQGIAVDCSRRPS